MKIIDLLNKIANGEEMPKKIKFENYIYIWRDIQKEYFCEQINHSLESIIGEYLFENLNLEVEIIEEDKEIEKLENEIEFYSYSKYEELKNDIDKVLYILKAINLVEDKISNLNNKINEIIDYLMEDKQ